MPVLDIELKSVFDDKGVKAAKTAIKGFEDVATGLQKSVGSPLSKMGDALGSAVKKGAVVATAAVAAVGTAFVAFTTDSVMKAADLESQISGIGAVLGKTKNEIEPLKVLIQDLGLDPKLKVSATEAADAIDMLARNGLDMDEILQGAARSTVLLANSTGGEFSQAADIATDTMAIFNIKAKDMDRAVNGITGVVNNSKFSIDDYALALAQGGGVAGSVGVSFDDFNTTIAAISPLFASGSDAGTSLKTMLTRLVPASDNAQNAMRSLGIISTDYGKAVEWLSGRVNDDLEPSFDSVNAAIRTYVAESGIAEEGTAKFDKEVQKIFNQFGRNEFFDATGQMKDMADISGVLAEAFKDLSEEQKNEQLATIFGSDAMRAAIAIADTGQEKFLELKSAIGNTDAEESAATRMDNLKGSMEILSGIVETLQLKIGEKFIPVVRRMTDQFSEFLSNDSEQIVSFFENLATETSNAIDELMPMIESWLPKLQQGFEDFKTKVVPLVKEWIPKLGSLIVALGQAIGPLIDAAGKLIGKFAEMDSGQQRLVVAIGAVVVALPTIIPIATGLVTAIGGIVSIITGGGGLIAAFGLLTNPIGLTVAAVAGLALAWKTDFGGIRTKTTEVVFDIQSKLGSFADSTSMKWSRFTSDLSEDWGDAFSDAKTVVTDAYDKIKDDLDDWKQIGKDIVNGVLDGIGSMSTTAFNKIGDFFDDAVNWAKKKLGIASPSTVFAGIGENMIEGLQGGLDSKRASVMNWMNEFTGTLTEQAEASLLEVETTWKDGLAYIGDTVIGHGEDYYAIGNLLPSVAQPAPVVSDAVQAQMAAIAASMEGANAILADSLERANRIFTGEGSTQGKIDSLTLIAETFKSNSESLFGDSAKAEERQAWQEGLRVVNAEMIAQLQQTLRAEQSAGMSGTNGILALINSVKSFAQDSFGSVGDFLSGSSYQSINRLLTSRSDGNIGEAIYSLLSGSGSDWALNTVRDYLSTGTQNGSLYSGASSEIRNSFTMNYQTTQSSQSMLSDVELLNLLYGGA